MPIANLYQNLTNYGKPLPLILLGIALRVLFGYLYTNVFDFTNSMVITNSIIQTGDVTDGLHFLTNYSGVVIQIYGKIYYQVAAGWIVILEWLGVLPNGSITTIPAIENLAQYQIVLIKSMQFIYDFLLLYFLLKVTKLLTSDTKDSQAIVLFWAINPYTIYAGFGAFQSDLAMLAFLVGGVYFALLAHTQKHHTIQLNQIFLACSLGIGAAMKLVPLLFIFPLLISLNKNVLRIATYLVVFAAAFLLISQPWASDFNQFQTFFFVTQESTAILSYTLLGIPLFLIAYGIFLLGISIHRHRILHKTHLIYVCLILFSIIYIFEPFEFLYAHLNIWILPFIVIASFFNYRAILFITAPVIGFYQWIIAHRIDSLFGNTLFQPVLYAASWSLRVFLIALYVYFIYVITQSFHRKNKTAMPNYTLLFVSLLILHVVFLVINKMVTF